MVSTIILGVAPTTTLRRHIEGLEASTKARFEAAPKEGKARRFKEFFDGAASWSRVERIVARVEAGAEGPDTRFIVTNLKVRNARVLYEDVYCRRGQAENHIKSWKTHLAADRTSCTKATANQFRLFLHAGAYWLMWGLRVVDAEALDVARRAVRHVAPAAHQDRRARRRDEDDDQDFTCRRRAPLRIFCVSCSGVSRASSPERRGAAPRMSSPSRQPENILHPAFWLVAGENAVRSRATKTANNHACTLECGA